MLLPGGPEGSASMIAQALSIFKTINNASSVAGAAGAPSANFPSVFGDDSKTDDQARVDELDTLSAPDPMSDPNAGVFSLRRPQK